MEVGSDLVDHPDRRGRADRRHARQVARAQGLRLALGRDAATIAVVAGFAVAVTDGLARLLTQDGWLALVAGREIVRYGLPVSDRLTLWSAGRRWVDQQWLGQLALYAPQALGGVRFLLVVVVLIAIATFAASVVFSRRRGASPRSTALIAALALVPALTTLSTVRAQSLAAPLFLATVLLLLHVRSRRVFLVFPLLIVWANVHGSVTLGAALTTAAGIALAWERRRVDLRVVALITLPVACVFASPYAASLPAYYRSTLFNAEFGRVVTEWHTTSPTLANAPVYLLAALALWLLRRASAFERAALVLTGAAAFTAVRNVGWFALVAVVVLPRLLDMTVVPRDRPRLAPVRMGLLVASVAGAALAVAGLVRSPAAALAELYPPRAAAAVAAQLAARPEATVFADDRYADWVLWDVPGARGRVVFDARFELLSGNRLRQLHGWASLGRRSALAGASLAVVRRRARGAARIGGKILYADHRLAVLEIAP